MKRLGMLVTVVMLMVVFLASVNPVKAQGFQTNGNTIVNELTDGMTGYWYVLLDSLQTYNSKHFSLNKYDNESYYTYPPQFARLLTSSAGTPKVTAIVQGTYDQSNYTNVDTLMNANSTETFTRGSFNINDWKFPLYRIQFTEAVS